MQLNIYRIVKRVPLLKHLICIWIISIIILIYINYYYIKGELLAMGYWFNSHLKSTSI